jgi:hypothetical protein
MITARSVHKAILLPDGRVLIAGGWAVNNTPSAALASAEIYDPTAGKFSSTASMSVARVGFTDSILPDGRVLLAGGQNASGNLASSEIYDPATGKFSASGSLSTLRVGHTATVLRDGRVLLVGGNDASSALASAELYQP